MARKRTSVFWTTPKDELVEIVKSSSSLKEIATKIGKSTKGGSFFILKNRLNEDNIDYSHIQLGSGHNKGKNLQINKPKPIAEILVEESHFSRFHLKKRLIKEGILEYKCSICGNTGIWNNKKMTLELDHINGKSNDNRIENIRFLCPNCHSQTDTSCKGLQKPDSSSGDHPNLLKGKML